MLLVEQMGEKLIRGIDRRKFLKRCAVGIFSVTAAWAAELTLVPSAEAINYCQYQESGCTCDIGVFCNIEYNSSWCSGPNCVKPPCDFSTRSYPTGCWCTDVCCGGGGGFYYECCDCKCNNSGQIVYCGCQQRVKTVGC